MRRASEESLSSRGNTKHATCVWIMFQNKQPLCILMSLVKILSNIVFRLKRWWRGYRLRSHYKTGTISNVNKSTVGYYFQMKPKINGTTLIVLLVAWKWVPKQACTLAFLLSIMVETKTCIMYAICTSLRTCFNIDDSQKYVVISVSRSTFNGHKSIQKLLIMAVVSVGLGRCGFHILNCKIMYLLQS